MNGVTPSQEDQSTESKPKPKPRPKSKSKPTQKRRPLIMASKKLTAVAETNTVQPVIVQAPTMQRVEVELHGKPYVLLRSSKSFLKHLAYQVIVDSDKHPTMTLLRDVCFAQAQGKVLQTSEKEKKLLSELYEYLALSTKIKIKTYQKPDEESD